MVSDTRPEADEALDDVRWPVATVAGAAALAVVLVLIELGDRSLWYDEAFSIGIVDRPLGDALWRISHWELNQSPFFLLLTGWVRLGESESFLRLLPAVSYVLSVPAVAVLGRRVAGPRVGAVAALLLALHPLALQWGQQLRGYSLVTLVAIVTTTLLLRALDTPEARAPSIAYGAAAAVATYAHFFFGLVVVGHVLWLVLRRPLPRRLLLTAGATYGVLVLPLVEYFLTRDGDPLSWVRDDGIAEIVRDTAVGLAGGSLVGLAVYGVAFVAGGVMAWRTSGPVALLVLWVVVPPVLVTVSTLTVKPLLETRFLVVIVPALALVAAVAVVRLPAAAGAGLLALLVLVSGVGLVRWYTGDPAEDWRSATAFAATVDPDADVVLEPWGGVFAYRYYEDRLDLPTHDVLRPRPFLAPGDDRVVEIRREDEDGGPVDPDSFTGEWLAHNGYRPVATRTVPGLTIIVHERGEG